MKTEQTFDSEDIVELSEEGMEQAQGGLIPQIICFGCGAMAYWALHRAGK